MTFCFLYISYSLFLFTGHFLCIYGGGNSTLSLIKYFSSPLLWLLSVNFRLRHQKPLSWRRFCRKWCPWFSGGVTESEAGWMCGLARGQTGAETGHGTDRRGFGGPAVLLGRAVVQSVVGVGQRGPACLASVQRADGLIPQPHRTGRGTERSGRKARGGASGTSHLSHAGHATAEIKKQNTPTPTTNTQAEMKNKMMRIRKGRVNIRKKERKTGAEKENQGMK